MSASKTKSFLEKGVRKKVIHVVLPEWITDSISKNKLQPISSYLLIRDKNYNDISEYYGNPDNKWNSDEDSISNEVAEKEKGFTENEKENDHNSPNTIEQKKKERGRVNLLKFKSTTKFVSKLPKAHLI